MVYCLVSKGAAMKTSVTIKAAWIVAAAMLSATIIAGFFGLFKPSRPDPALQIGGSIYGDLSVINAKGNVSVQHYDPNVKRTILSLAQGNTSIKELVAILEQRAANVLKIMDQEKQEAILRIRNGLVFY